MIEIYYESIKNKLLNILNPLKYKIIPIKNGLNQTQRKTKIIVSLTSIPSRFSKLPLCIEGLLRQSMKPDEIILYLGIENKNIELPKQLIEQTKKGLTIEYREDLKPHTKYYYAIQEHKNDIVITVDDDIYYDKDLIKILYNSYLKYPKAISCMRPHKITFNKDINPYNLWKMEYSEEDSVIPSHYLFATGVGGVLYPPNILPKETFDIENIKKYSFKQDDLWLKFIELKNDIKVVKASKKKYHLYTIKDTQKISLRQDNVSKNQNDIYINKLYKYFKINKNNFYE
ncbi:MAG: glycosyltransferase family 2 protein [Bacilli bacterium]|nr:glycosyltransferase family 2 protein [Bacilli bacterium]